jgi:hypothetical protein
LVILELQLHALVILHCFGRLLAARLIATALFEKADVDGNRASRRIHVGVFGCSHPYHMLTGIERRYGAGARIVYLVSIWTMWIGTHHTRPLV